MLELVSQIRRIAPHFEAFSSQDRPAWQGAVARALHSFKSGREGEFRSLELLLHLRDVGRERVVRPVREGRLLQGAHQETVGVFEYADGWNRPFGDESRRKDAAAAAGQIVARLAEPGDTRGWDRQLVRKVNVRVVVAATHRDLPEMVRQGKFREDLYFRLAMIELKVPSLGNARGPAHR